MNDPLEDLIRHAPAIRQLAVRLVGTGDADDVVQDTYLRAMRQRPPRDALAWLSCIATNVARCHYRSDTRRRRRETLVVDDAAREAPSADAALLKMEAAERVSRGLRALAEPYRTTLMQRYYLAWSNAQIADAAGIGEAAVRQRQKRAIGMLQDILERSGPGRSAVSRDVSGASPDHSRRLRYERANQCVAVSSVGIRSSAGRHLASGRIPPASLPRRDFHVVATSIANGPG